MDLGAFTLKVVEDAVARGSIHDCIVTFVHLKVRRMEALQVLYCEDDIKFRLALLIGKGMEIYLLKNLLLIAVDVVTIEGKLNWREELLDV